MEIEMLVGIVVIVMAIGSLGAIGETRPDTNWTNSQEDK